MAMISMEVPEDMVTFMVPRNTNEQLKRNAMILYPYVQEGVISYGRAAEILGIYKMDIITLYGKMGIPYIEMSDDEINEELETVKYLKEVLP